MNKLKSKRGESMTEVLVSILIVVFSAAMLATVVTVSVNININTRAATKEFYNEITLTTSTETVSSLPSGSIAMVGSKEVTIDFYGDADGLIAYRKAVTP